MLSIEEAVSLVYDRVASSADYVQVFSESRLTLREEFSSSGRAQDRIGDFGVGVTQLQKGHWRHESCGSLSETVLNLWLQGLDINEPHCGRQLVTSKNEPRNTPQPLLSNPLITPFGSSGSLSIWSENIRRDFAVQSSDADLTTAHVAGARLRVEATLHSEDRRSRTWARHFRPDPADEWSQDKISKLVVSVHSAAEYNLSAIRRLGHRSSSVVLSGKAAGLFFHEVLAHAMESDNLPRKAPLLDRMRNLDFPSELHIFDSAGIPGRFGSYDIDDDGTLASKKTLIGEGKLQAGFGSLIFPAEGALMQGGSGRRGSYRNATLPRQSNLVVAKGSEDLDYHPTQTLVVHDASSGEVVVSTGAFHMLATSATWYDSHGGETPLTDVVIFGDSIDALKSIEAVGKAPVVDHISCIKQGQELGISVESPSIRVGQLTWYS